MLNITRGNNFTLRCIFTRDDTPFPIGAVSDLQFRLVGNTIAALPDESFLRCLGVRANAERFYLFESFCLLDNDQRRET